MVIKKGF